MTLPSSSSSAPLRQLAGLSVLAVAIFVTFPAAAQTGPELLLKPFAKELAFDGDLDAWVTDTAHAKQTDAEVKIGAADFEGRFRLQPGEVASPRIGFNFKYFDIDSQVPGLPEQLYDQSVGAGFAFAKWENWIFAASGGIGYAGTSPFGDGNAWYFQANIVAVRELSETSVLIIGIDYDGNRTYKPDIPLPGFAYSTRVDDTLLVTLGLPVTGLQWEPIKELRVELNYLLVSNYDVRVGYTFMKGFEIYGTLGQRTDAFFQDESDNSRDRLIFQQKRAEAGLTIRSRAAGLADRDLEFVFAAGYAFDSEFSVGFDSGNSDLLVDVSDVPYIRFGLTARF